MSSQVRIFRRLEWAFPIRPVQREVLVSKPDEDAGLFGSGGRRPPLLFVPGFRHGAWVFAEHWLEHAAERGFPAYAMSLRGHGESADAPKTTLRAFTHDVVQVAARLPRQAVLIGHGIGGLAVARALARYPARAGVLVAPVFGGFDTFWTALVRNPPGTLPAVFGARLTLRRGQLFGHELGTPTARDYAARMAGGRAAPLAQWQMLLHRAPDFQCMSYPLSILQTILSYG